MRRRLTAMIAGAGAAVLIAPASAGAHVTLQPQEAPAKAFAVLNVRVPNEEEDAGTTKVAVRFPEGFAGVRYEAVPGWRVTVKTAKLDQPIETGEGEPLTEQVSQVTFSGGRIAPGEFQEFPLSMQIPDKPGTSLTFKATQTYDNGKVVRWIGPPDADEPAPIVRVTAAEEEHGAAEPVAATSEEGDDDEDSNGLAIVALVVGALGLVTGGAALLTRRRA